METQVFKLSLEDRKNYIADVAAKIFYDKGYKSASLQDIAEMVGISKAAVYHYFKTKEDILYYIIDNHTNYCMDALQNCIDRCEEENLPRLETFRNLAIAYASVLNKDTVVPLLILRERHQLTGEYKSRLYQIEQKIFRYLRKEAEKVTDIKEGYNLNAISFLIISYSHWMKYWLKENRELTTEDAIEQAMDIIFFGMLEK